VVAPILAVGTDSWAVAATTPVAIADVVMVADTTAEDITVAAEPIWGSAVGLMRTGRRTVTVMRLRPLVDTTTGTDIGAFTQAATPTLTDTDEDELVRLQGAVSDEPRLAVHGTRA
jgi:hypothetical protein